MTRPDFGKARDEFLLKDALNPNGRAIVYECKFVAPGLTMADLVGIFENASRLPGPATRGITAVADAVNAGWLEFIKQS